MKWSDLFLRTFHSRCQFLDPCVQYVFCDASVRAGGSAFCLRALPGMRSPFFILPLRFSGGREFCGYSYDVVFRWHLWRVRASFLSVFARTNSFKFFFGTLAVFPVFGRDGLVNTLCC